MDLSHLRPAQRSDVKGCGPNSTPQGCTLCHIVYVPTEFLAHLVFGHRGDAVLQMIGQASELYEDGLNKRELKGQHHLCER